MISYREWTTEDAGGLRQMVGALHESMRPYDVNYPPASAIIADYFDFLQGEVADTAGTFLLAEDEGRLLGFACVFGLMAPFTPDEDPAKFTFVSDLYVDPAYQRQGIGSALLQRAEAYGLALGAPRIELAVHAANAALEIYTHLGYQQRLIIMSKRL